MTIWTIIAVLVGGSVGWGFGYLAAFIAKNSVRWTVYLLGGTVGFVVAATIGGAMDFSTFRVSTPAGSVSLAVTVWGSFAFPIGIVIGARYRRRVLDNEAPRGTSVLSPDLVNPTPELAPADATPYQSEAEPRPSTMPPARFRKHKDASIKPPPDPPRRKEWEILKRYRADVGEIASRVSLHGDEGALADGVLALPKDQRSTEAIEEIAEKNIAATDAVRRPFRRTDLNNLNVFLLTTDPTAAEELREAVDIVGENRLDFFDVLTRLLGASGSQATDLYPGLTQALTVIETAFYRMAEMDRQLDDDLEAGPQGTARQADRIGVIAAEHAKAKDSLTKILDDGRLAKVLKAPFDEMSDNLMAAADDDAGDLRDKLNQIGEIALDTISSRARDSGR